MEDKDWEVVVGRKPSQPKSSKFVATNITKKTHDKKAPLTSPRSNAAVKLMKTEGSTTIAMPSISNVKKRNKNDKLNGLSNQSKKNVPTKTTSVALFDLVILSAPKPLNSSLPIQQTTLQLNSAKQAAPVHQQNQQKPSAPTSNKMSDELKPKSFVVKKKKKKMMSTIKKRILMVNIFFFLLHFLNFPFFFIMLHF